YWGCSQGVGLFFQVISSPHYSVVLGYPWLQKHNPTFDWQSAEVLSWSPQCGAGCIRCFFGLHNFHCGIFHGPLRRFRRFCSGLIPVVFGPLSAFWDSPTIIESLSGTSPRWP
ncbi:unnamed protein product, partial [Staurois parvus]